MDDAEPQRQLAIGGWFGDPPGSKMRDEGLRLAIEAAGGVGALARGLGIKQPSVSSWARIPAERVIAVEQLTGVARGIQLRPDLYQ